MQETLQEQGLRGWIRLLLAIRAHLCVTKQEVAVEGSMRNTESGQASQGTTAATSVAGKASLSVRRSKVRFQLVLRTKTNYCCPLSFLLALYARKTSTPPMMVASRISEKRASLLLCFMPKVSKFDDHCLIGIEPRTPIVQLS